jgi:hypothetical protein
MIMPGNCAPKLIPKLIMTTTSFCLGASLVLLACSPAVAGDCSPPSILLNALDSNFKIERDLRAEDIKVEVDRKQAQILSLSLDIHPRRIVVMVDSSGSMEASPQKSGWGITLPAAAYAVDVLPASASSALVTFSDNLRRESSDFENRKLVGARVLDLANRQPKGPTSLFDSIDQVLVEFKELHFGDAIYLVTDGMDNKSRISLPKLEKELISRGVRVFVFLIARARSRTEEEMSGASQMDGFAESTGGEVVRISSAEIAGNERAQLDKLAPRIVGQVEGVYHLELGFSEVEKAARVKVAFSDRDRIKNTLSIAYSHQIVPCQRKP